MESINEPRMQTKLHFDEAYYYRLGSLCGGKRALSSKLTSHGRITINDLVKMKCPLKAVAKIDLAETELDSNDLEYVLELLQNLKNDGKLSNAIILLNNNRIHGIQGMGSKC